MRQKFPYLQQLRQRFLELAQQQPSGEEGPVPPDEGTLTAVAISALVQPKELQGGFVLINSEERERQHPETWRHLPPDVLDGVGPGDLVKVAVEGPGYGGERFWTVVTDVVGEGFVVAVDNELVLTAKHGVKRGDRLLVGREHIFDVWGGLGPIITSGMVILQPKNRNI